MLGCYIMMYASQTNDGNQTIYAFKRSIADVEHEALNWRYCFLEVCVACSSGIDVQHENVLQSFVHNSLRSVLHLVVKLFNTMVARKFLLVEHGVNRKG